MESSSSTSAPDEVALLIDSQIFKVRKEILTEYSDYFRAMFSGNYVENQQNEIKIDVVDANSMNIILQYMNIGLIDLSEYPLHVINDLTVAANFLQITELVKQIEYTLEIQLTVENWIETMAIAENASFSKLEHLCLSFGLYSFKNMKPKYIPSMHKLFWYLSHPCLDIESETDVFNFGFEWIINSETGADALMLILGCLDISKLTVNNLLKFQELIKYYETSLAAKVVDCLLELFTIRNSVISLDIVTECKESLCAKFTERVYVEVLNLVRESKQRKSNLTPTVPMWTWKDCKPEYIPHYMYTFSQEKGFEKWLEVAEKDLWGWSVTSWGPWRLVVVGGEHGRGTSNFMRDVKIYDTLKKEWTHHGAMLPSRRHGGVAVLGDTLFIIGGVGGFRVVLETATTYDLKERSHRKIANLPDAIQGPAVCNHKGHIYAAGHNNIYKYEDLGSCDRWLRIVCTEIRMSCMVSFKDTIYCTQNYFSHLYAFNPEVDRSLEMITCFSNPPATMCNLGKHLLFFTRNMCGVSDILNSAEEYNGISRNEIPKVIWSEVGSTNKVNDVAGSATLIMNVPPMCRELSAYHKKYLDRYTE